MRQVIEGDLYFMQKKQNLISKYIVQIKYDLVIATPQADPKLLLSLPKKTKLVFDFADAYMAESPFSIRGLLRGLFRFYKGYSSKFYLNYKNAFIDIMKRSCVVICSSPEQKKIILPFCKNVFKIIYNNIFIIGYYTRDINTII